MLIGSNLYFDILFFILGLTAFIPAWVFSLLAWQVYFFDGVCFLQSESDFLEFFWTVIPTFIVAFLCYLNLVYIIGNVGGLDLEGQIIKVIGRQWYWSYEHDTGEVYDSLMENFLDDVDKPVRVIHGKPCNFLVTSADVIHSFSLPLLGLKIDGIPGRVNHLFFFPERLGVEVGYCTELCGAGHAYMPVIVEVVSDQYENLRIPQLV